LAGAADPALLALRVLESGAEGLLEEGLFDLLLAELAFHGGKDKATAFMLFRLDNRFFHFLGPGFERVFELFVEIFERFVFARVRLTIAAFSRHHPSREGR
jgi:hypothetical protein